MSGKLSLRFCLIFLLVMLVVLPAGWFLFQRFEGEIPAVTIQPSIVSIGESQTVKFTFLDNKSGIRKIRIAITKDGKEKILYDNDYPSMGFGKKGDVNKETIDLLIESKKLGFPMAEPSCTLPYGTIPGKAGGMAIGILLRNRSWWIHIPLKLMS